MRRNWSGLTACTATEKAWRKRVSMSSSYLGRDTTQHFNTSYAQYSPLQDWTLRCVSFWPDSIQILIWNKTSQKWVPTSWIWAGHSSCLHYCWGGRGGQQIYEVKQCLKSIKTTFNRKNYKEIWNYVLSLISEWVWGPAEWLGVKNSTTQFFSRDCDLTSTSVN